MKTVMLVDDIPEYADAMELNLPESCRSVSVHSAAEARLLMVNTSPDLAVLDIRLNEAEEDNREGLELLKWIKSHHPFTPVIMISAYKDFEFEVESLTLGAEYFLRKPIQPNEFRSCVKKVLNI